MVVLKCLCCNANIAEELKCSINEYFLSWKTYIFSSLLLIKWFVSICESCQELEMKREWVQTLEPLTILKLIIHEKQSTTEVVTEVQPGKSWACNRFFGMLFHTFNFFSYFLSSFQVQHYFHSCWYPDHSLLIPSMGGLLPGTGIAA